MELSLSLAHMFCNEMEVLTNSCQPWVEWLQYRAGSQSMCMPRSTWQQPLCPLLDGTKE